MADDPNIYAYQVRVNTSFFAFGTNFSPAFKYQVSAEMYNSTLPDGRRFKDLCARAFPRLNPESLP